MRLDPTRAIRHNPVLQRFQQQQQQQQQHDMILRHASSPPSPPGPKQMIRLSKRMGELDMFSRREADRLILDGRVLVDEKVVEVGHKVPWNLQADRIEIIGNHGSATTSAAFASTGERTNDRNKSNNTTQCTERMAAVVLNKPKGYVSGQAEHGHPPAIRLLTSRNRFWGRSDRDDKDIGRDGGGKYDWTGFAPAGRLDLDSTGLMVYTKNGVLAKKLIGAASPIEKEYVVDVEPAASPTKRELSIDPKFVLPSQRHQRSYDLSPILGGGRLLLGEDRPLKACPDARWIIKGERLRIVLTEGRKHQIRRMCRELLGFHVVGLRRVRIGPIVLSLKETVANGSDAYGKNDDTLPLGCWRPMRQGELEILLPKLRR